MDARDGEMTLMRQQAPRIGKNARKFSALAFSLLGFLKKSDWKMSELRSNLERDTLKR